VARDRAYHQGSVYPWLLGAYADATVRVRGKSQAVRDELRGCLDACIEQINGDGMGQLCELFDGDVPRRPGGAIADARSVGEVLRAYLENVLAIPPGSTLNTDGVTPIPKSFDVRH
jgi:glycogen debranching enzyme